ncbi:LicD family protein [Weissella viridescens]|uniref:LicD family protein n=1 Tax=Weissella viridescens TaxID=1629 RepID=UPI003AA82868
MVERLKTETVHAVMLEMLNDVATFANEHDLKLFLLGGTLLGSVRDGALIPWDDDVDVGFMRKDYNQFLATYEPSNPRFELLTETNPKNLVPYLRVVDRQTQAESDYYEQTHGIFIDIFPIDAFNKKSWQLKWFFVKQKGLNILRNVGRSTDRYPSDEKLVGLKRVLKMLLPHLSAHRVAQKQSKMAQKFAQGAQQPTQAGVLNGMYGPKEIFPVTMWQKAHQVTFEGMPVWQPDNADQYLTQFFGDWRKPVKNIDKHGSFYLKEKK